MPTTGTPAAFSRRTTPARSSLKSDTISATRALNASRSPTTEGSVNSAVSRAESSSQANVSVGGDADNLAPQVARQAHIQVKTGGRLRRSTPAGDNLPNWHYAAVHSQKPGDLSRDSRPWWQATSHADSARMSKTVSTSQSAAIRAPRKPVSRRTRRALVALEAATGALALAGGVLLAAAPDGSLLRADPRVLAGTPFSDWRVPGVLLATLVGGGYLLTGWWQSADRWHARELSLFAGTGLIAYEAAELAWLGFQPLEAVFAGVGVVTVALAWRMQGTADPEYHKPGFPYCKEVLWQRRQVESLRMTGARIGDGLRPIRVRW